MFSRPDSRSLSRKAVALVGAAWAIGLAPMTTLGFGSDVDAWLVGQRAVQMWTTGAYARSRSTGFPLYEIAVTPLVVTGGWVASNLFSVAAGLVVLWLIYRLASARTLRHPLISALLLMTAPAFVKNATSTMDYVPAMALLLGAYVAVNERRAILAALLVGIACGVRPTSALFIVPVACAVLADGRTIRHAAVVLFVAAATGLVAFFPSLRLGAFGVTPVTGWVNGILNGMRLLGIVQTFVTLIILAAVLYAARGQIGSRGERPFVVFHAVNLLVWGALFAWLPGEPEYLFVCLLSLVLVVDRYASARAATGVLAVLATYHLVAIDVEGSRGGQRQASVRLVPGMTVRDIDDRRFKLWLREATTTARVDGHLLVMEQVLPPVVGSDVFAYDPQRDLFTRRDGRLSVSQLITDVPALVELRHEGVRVVAWEEREWQYRLPENRAAHDLVEFIGDPGGLLQVPMRGRPADLPRAIP